MARPAAALDQALAVENRNGGWECSKMLAELARTDELYFDRVSQIRMPERSRGRIAMVGDAAFCVSLLAGRGACDDLRLCSGR
jgi:2-polyprenyl-6-methoxyphenol hydroxylase-like FAD-dependent oxidoreductase